MSTKPGGFWSDFRTFAIKGDVLDLAIAVVVGNAFGAVVNGLVSDIITPLLGLVTGNGTTDVKNLSLTLRAGYSGNGTTTPPLLLQYGSFIQTSINFFIIALSIFIVFRLISGARKRLFRQGEDAVPEYDKPAQERLLEEIRDLLKSRQPEGVGTPTKASEERK